MKYLPCLLLQWNIHAALNAYTSAIINHINQKNWILNLYIVNLDLNFKFYNYLKYIPESNKNSLSGPIQFRRYVMNLMKNLCNSQFYLKKGYYSMFLLTSLVFNRNLFVESVVNPFPFHLCETNKDFLLSQNSFVNRPLVGKSSYNLVVALLTIILGKR